MNNSQPAPSSSLEILTINFIAHYLAESLINKGDINEQN